MEEFDTMIDNYQKFLRQLGKSENTIKSYTYHVNEYIKWFQDTFGSTFRILYRENVLDFFSYLKNVRKQSGQTFNSKHSALMQLNNYLIDTSAQEDVVVYKQDKHKLQKQHLSPSKINDTEVEKFRQSILENESKRDHAIVTLLAYTGMRISEALSIKLESINLTSKEVVIIYGKGNKQRLAILNDKIINAIRSYLVDRKKMKHSTSEYLFISRSSDTLNRTVVNRLFKKHSNIITPKELRHFFCSNALEKEWAVHEVAAQVGHTNINTTMIYTHPTLNVMKNKANNL